MGGHGNRNHVQIPWQQRSHKGRRPGLVGLCLRLSLSLYHRYNICTYKFIHPILVYILYISIIYPSDLYI